jgi:hypothetical protein
MLVKAGSRNLRRWVVVRRPCHYRNSGSTFPKKPIVRSGTSSQMPIPTSTKSPKVHICSRSLCALSVPIFCLLCPMAPVFSLLCLATHCDSSPSSVEQNSNDW